MCTKRFAVADHLLFGSDNKSVTYFVLGVSLFVFCLFYVNERYTYINLRLTNEIQTNQYSGWSYKLTVFHFCVQ